MINDDKDMINKFNVEFIKVKNIMTEMTDFSFSFIKNVKLSLLFLRLFK